MRLIDADALYIDYLYSTTTTGTSCWGYVSMKQINSAPTIEAVQEREKGKWLDKEVVDDRKDAKIQQWQQARCSICYKWHTTPYMYYFTNYNFCPHCGAKMEGAEE